MMNSSTDRNGFDQGNDDNENDVVKSVDNCTSQNSCSSSSPAHAQGPIVPIEVNNKLDSVNQMSPDSDERDNIEKEKIHENVDVDSDKVDLKPTDAKQPPQLEIETEKVSNSQQLDSISIGQMSSLSILSASDDELKAVSKNDNVDQTEQCCDNNQSNSVTTSECSQQEIVTLHNLTSSPSPTKQDMIHKLISNKIKDKEVYPDDLNPFGDEEEEEEVENPQSSQFHTKVDDKLLTTNTFKPVITVSQCKQNVDPQYPTDLNPFGEDDEEDEVLEEKEKTSIQRQSSNTYSKSLNPFGSDDEEEEEEEAQINHSTPYKYIPQPTQRKSIANASPTPSQKLLQQYHGSSTPNQSRMRKRLAPKPPMSPSSSMGTTINHNRSASVNESNDSRFGNENDTNSLYDSMISNVSSSSSVVSASRTPTPVPRRSKMGTITSTHTISNDEVTNAKIKMIKSKKRPAPPIPSFKRAVKSSIEEIEKELNEIGDQLPVVEQKRIELEEWLLNNKPSVDDNNGVDKDKVPEQQIESKPEEKEISDPKYEEMLKEFIETAKNRCKLARKQKELMYMKRENKLEETQADIEYQLRVIMSKQDAQKTDEDRMKEKELFGQLMEIIDERNDIIENLIIDENKEIEEYQNLVSKIIPSINNESSLTNKPTDENGLVVSTNSGHKANIKHISLSMLKMKRSKKNKKKANNSKSDVKRDSLSTDNEENNDENDLSSFEMDKSKQRAVDDSSLGLKSKTKPHKEKKHFTLGRSTLKKLSPKVASMADIKMKFTNKSSAFFPNKSDTTIREDTEASTKP